LSIQSITKFRLYIAGDAPNSLLAVANLNDFCQRHLANPHEVEVVDVFQDPNRAVEDRIVLAPTLLQFSPLPVLRLVGPLTNLYAVANSLGPQAGSL
jgi:circadian clock protein KaiB